MTFLLVFILLVLMAFLGFGIAGRMKAMNNRLDEAGRQIVELQNRVDSLEMQAGIAQSDCQSLSRRLLDLQGKLGRH